MKVWKKIRRHACVVVAVYTNIVGIGANCVVYVKFVENIKDYKMTSNKQYHSLQKLSHSLIVACRDKGCLAAFKESPFNPERIEEEPKNALEMGQL